MRDGGALYETITKPSQPRVEVGGGTKPKKGVLATVPIWFTVRIPRVGHPLFVADKLVAADAWIQCQGDAPVARWIRLHGSGLCIPPVEISSQIDLLGLRLFGEDEATLPPTIGMFYRRDRGGRTRRHRIAWSGDVQSRGPSGQSTPQDEGRGKHRGGVGYRR